MARWYGRIKGNRGEATRMGTERSGFTAHISGWNVGVKVDCRVDERGEDVIEVYRTGGNNDPSRKELLGILPKLEPFKLEE